MNARRQLEPSALVRLHSHCRHQWPKSDLFDSSTNLTGSHLLTWDLRQFRVWVCDSTISSLLIDIPNIYAQSMGVDGIYQMKTDMEDNCDGGTCQ